MGSLRMGVEVIITEKPGSEPTKDSLWGTLRIDLPTIKDRKNFQKALTVSLDSVEKKMITLAEEWFKKREGKNVLREEA